MTSSNLQSAIRNPQSRRGITLIELLIVIVIMVTLVAAAIPLMAPASDARRIREAARALNTYITSAQSRAINTGRPHGIVLKKLSSDTNSPADNGVCLEVFQCEQPAPFAGFDERACVRFSLDRRQQNGGMRVQFLTRVSPDQVTDDYLPPGLDNDAVPPGVFRTGDVIEAGGKRYQFTDTNRGADGFYFHRSGNPDGQLLIRPLDPSGYFLNFSFKELDPELYDREYLHWTAPLPYKILRQPMMTSTEPYQLPEGTAIDLRASGDQEVSFHAPDGDPSQNQRNDNGDAVIVMFTPEGSVERVRVNLLPSQIGGTSFIDSPTTYNLFLLIGLRENVPVEPSDFSQTFSTQEDLEEKKAEYNWLNLDSRWVMIGPQSGNVVTVENAFVEPRDNRILALSNGFDRRNEEIRRAREFAREMTRTGGR
ncbi:MAG: type II secretion system protein [Pirellulales bacterium]